MGDDALTRGRETRMVASPHSAGSRERRLPLYLRIRPQSANELGGTRSLQAPQVLSTKQSAPAYSFGGSSGARLVVSPATSPGPVYKVRSTLGTASISFGTAEQRPRAPNQKRFSGHSTSPGPASYTLPPSIGSSMVLGRMRSSRASSFGTAPARGNFLPQSAQTPGAKYDLPRNATREGLRPQLGATWSNQPRYPESAELSSRPGPASYSRPSSIGRGNVESTLRNEPGFGFGTSSRANSDFAAVALRRSKDYPGAGTYMLGSTLGAQLLSNKRSSNGRAFSRADRFKELAVAETFLEGAGYASLGYDTTPGPGQYVV
ncbi:hypothetical protein KFE25_005610 [Diacronema lutheri]|uniref:Uncharacterized protein n=1 Tax=Diacronema lutheri TaxID=2081491 RepID=A0A8J6CDM7_DIALT|nr:hypothetical protein KFE25_005610 [Diacronema lutheri]